MKGATLTRYTGVHYAMSVCRGGTETVAIPTPRELCAAQQLEVDWDKIEHEGARLRKEHPAADVVDVEVDLDLDGERFYRRFTVREFLAWLTEVDTC